ncbi:efflux RND transporter periplasmic adaptor subunit [Nitrospira lenta]|uniref:Putative Membrane-fusion protein of multidrug efflux transporter n=1 Tax=Nitrospira lenta TaxID=1436998 RepID=A0A330LCP7_9BACT|nr:efflux RND transporter periplasmic adaptor subunit [Nitrospira lenta]SPP66756.1 putative Membrane-fusion protein of multidrug efflux transporter [Nitrospira lenta]
MFRLLTGALLTLLVPTIGCQQESPSRPEKPATQATNDSGGTGEHGASVEIDPTHPVDVQVTKPSRQTLIYTITLPANISPRYQTTLYAKVSGYLKWIGPDKGDHVKKNQVVAIIDAPEVEEQYQQAVADYKIKKITFERLDKVLHESPDVIAKQDVDVAEATYEGAKNLMQQRAAMREYTKVRAPYDGIVTARFADPGALIQIATSSATNAIPLFTVMDLDTVRVYANVPQDDSAWIAPGKTKARVLLKELPDRSFTGTITRSTLALDPSTRSLLVELDLPNPDHALRPGTYAELALDLREIPNALALPPQAVVSGAKGTSVFIVAQGTAKSIPIQTGITNGTWMEITNGLDGTEDVVVVGKRRLLEGSPVQAAPFKLPEGKPAQQKFERRSAGQPPTPYEGVKP